MKTTEVRLKTGQLVTIHGDRGSLPILRILRFHAPHLVIEVWRSEGDPFMVGLSMLDLGDEPKEVPSQPPEPTQPSETGYDANGSESK